jgi:D-3-phosphoglycerate dehydrogenase
MATYRVLIAESRYTSYDEEKAALAAVDAEPVFERSDDEGTIAGLAADVDALIVNLAPTSAKVIGAMQKCRVISRYGVGVDNVDVAAASAKKIVVANVRDYCLDEVSDQALALLMACARKTSITDTRVRAGEWNIPRKRPIYRMAGRVFGLIGYGLIARRMHHKVMGLGFSEVLVCDPFVPDEQISRAGARKVELDELLKNADFVSVHAPMSAATRHMIGAAQLAMMKPTAILVNTSRGGLIDPDALYEALKAGTINSAGIDVFEPEPPGKDCRLFELENVVLSDHAGFYSEEAQRELQRKAAQNTALVLTGQKPLSCVNPEVLG